MATIIDLSAQQAIARSLQSSARLRPVKSVAPRCDVSANWGANTSLNEALADLAQRTLGTLFVLIGVALTLTLWLLPIGLPLGLLGCALIAAPRARA